MPRPALPVASPAHKSRKRCVASLCIGGSEATAVAVELVWLLSLSRSLVQFPPSDKQEDESAHGTGDRDKKPTLS